MADAPKLSSSVARLAQLIQGNRFVAGLEAEPGDIIPRFFQHVPRQILL